MTKSKSPWMKRQLSDIYVREAHRLGFRSRAAFKLVQIDNKFKIFKGNKSVLDLGSAPGGWLQIARRRTKNKVVGIDITDIEPIHGVEFFNESVEDFSYDRSPKEAIYDERIIGVDAGSVSYVHNDLSTIPTLQASSEIALCKGSEAKECFDIVLSDMAPSTIGDKKTDHLRIIYLAELALDTAIKHLKKEGIFVVKLFQGCSDREFFLKLSEHFHSVHRFKPEASRKESSEIYVVALGFCDK